MNAVEKERQGAFFPNNCGIMIPDGMPWPPAAEMHRKQRHKFSQFEDQILSQLVLQFGETNWNLISNMMKTRTPRQCRERYRNYLSSKVKNAAWSEQEEMLLRSLVSTYGQRWSKICGFFDSRSEVNVKNHWSALLSRDTKERMCVLSKPASSPMVTPKYPIPILNQVIPSKDPQLCVLGSSLYDEDDSFSSLFD